MTNAVVRLTDFKTLDIILKIDCTVLRSHIQEINQAGWQEAYRIIYSSWQSLNFRRKRLVVNSNH